MPDSDLESVALAARKHAGDAEFLVLRGRVEPVVVDRGRAKSAETERDTPTEHLVELEEAVPSGR